jgi:hypothetical protein
MLFLLQCFFLSLSVQGLWAAAEEEGGAVCRSFDSGRDQYIVLGALSYGRDYILLHTGMMTIARILENRTVLDS